MRELLENALYAPTAGRYKVYIIDEVHMLSRFAFNAMLKTLEEPPPHIQFILAECGILAHGFSRGCGSRRVRP